MKIITILISIAAAQGFNYSKTAELVCQEYESQPVNGFDI